MFQKNKEKKGMFKTIPGNKSKASAQKYVYPHIKHLHMDIIEDT